MRLGILIQCAPRFQCGSKLVVHDSVMIIVFDLDPSRAGERLTLTPPVPGPALFFVVVNGVPSNASWIMVGDGVIGRQTLQPRSTLPVSTISAQLVAQYGGSFM